MAIHPWLERTGLKIDDAAGKDIPAAATFADAVARGLVPGASLVAVYLNDARTHAIIHLEIEVERPQDLAHPIQGIEPVAVVFSNRDEKPAVLALREDFPDTFHQNATPPDSPASLCIDNRSWAETKLTYTPRNLGRQIQLWLSKAASGELHDTSLPPEPFFFPEQHTLILPAASVAPGGDQLPLMGYIREENPGVILAELDTTKAGRGKAGFTVLRFDAQPRTVGRMRHAPQTLGALADELKSRGLDLFAELKTRFRIWSAQGHPDGWRLFHKLILIIGFPGTDERGRTSTDIRAFLTGETAGRIGEILGVLFLQNSPVIGGPKSYVQKIGAPDGKSPADVVIGPVSVHLSYDRAIAGRIAGRDVEDRRHALLIGAGAIGSQIALNLAREGLFSWTIVDGDTLFPHNMARHALLPGDTGA